MVLIGHLKKNKMDLVKVKEEIKQRKESILNIINRAKMFKLKDSEYLVLNNSTLLINHLDYENTIVSFSVGGELKLNLNDYIK